MSTELMLPLSMPGDAFAKGRGKTWPQDWERQFRTRYPNKVDMARAIRKLDAIRRKGQVEFSDIINGVARYVAYLNDPSGWRPSPKHAATFVNNYCWCDEFNNGQQNGKPTPAQRAKRFADQARQLERDRGIV